MVKKIFNLLALLYKRRSTRTYQDRQIEQEKIDVLIQVALLAPSSRNRKPVELIVVTDTALLQKLSLSKETGANFLKEAPLAIVLLADKTKSDVWIEDVSIVATIIQLTAESLDLGSCWIQLRDRISLEGISSEEYVRKTLNIPEKFSASIILSIGYKAEKLPPYLKENLDTNKVSFNTYQQ